MCFHVSLCAEESVYIHTCVYMQLFTHVCASVLVRMHRHGHVFAATLYINYDTWLSRSITNVQKVERCIVKAKSDLFMFRCKLADQVPICS